MTTPTDGQPNAAGQDKETQAVDLNTEDGVVDVDMQGLLEAEKAVEAEEAAAAQAAAGQQEPEKTGPTPEEAAAAAEAAENNAALPPAPKPQPTAIPTPRFNEALRDLAKEREEKAAIQARLDLLTDLVKTGQMTPAMADAIREGRAEMPTQPTDPYADIDAAEIALAEKYDKNEISTVDWTKERQKLDRQRDVIRANQTRAAEMQTVEQQVAAATAKIQADFPVLETITNGQLEPLKGMAHVMAERALSNQTGHAVTYNPKDPAHVLEYRFQLGMAANRAYGDGLGPMSTRKGAQPTPTATPANQPGAQPTKTQVQDKLALAGRIPPQTATVRSAATGGLTADLEKQIEGMTTEELDAFEKANPGVLDAYMRK